MENAKIYARQVNPEWQETDIFDDEYYKDIIVKGNRNFYDHNTDLLDDIDNVAEDIYNIADFEGVSGLSTETDYIKVAAELSTCYATEHHTVWTEEEARRFMECDKKREHGMYYGYKCGEDPERYTAEMLSIYTGEKWEWATIRGCAQREWQTIYYPAEKYSVEDIEIFETGYFNTGTEWKIHDSDDVPESVEDITGYFIYCYTGNPRKELAEQLGVKPEDIVMYEVEMRYMPVYSEMV